MGSSSYLAWYKLNNEATNVLPHNDTYHVLKCIRTQSTISIYGLAPGSGSAPEGRLGAGLRGRGAQGTEGAGRARAPGEAVGRRCFSGPPGAHVARRTGAARGRPAFGSNIQANRSK